MAKDIIVVGGGIVGVCLAGARAFPPDHRRLARGPPGIITNMSVGADYPVAGNEKGHRVLTDGGADSACR